MKIAAGGCAVLGWIMLPSLLAWADEPLTREAVERLLKAPILAANATLTETQAFVEGRIPRMPPVESRAAWEAEAARIRREVLERVVFRGAAADWRDAHCGVEWEDVIDGGPGYRIKKLRYEALPGLWIPALLYEPTELSGKRPVVLNVNGHDGAGKAAGYKQIRCINQAKRGMLALNVEWLGMGQLRGEDHAHTRMNQLDLCGTSGLAPHYLAMSRGLDLLLAHPHADPQRVAVAGLSGGGWQTITISALDTRVTLTNPVAGYSSFLTRLQHGKDLGDSEQTPTDLATVADYTHLTALMAPRATLLTYNTKDNCCFEAGYALPPLVEAARPIFALYDRGDRLRTHENSDPGNHNFGLDNRQALYRMMGDHFFTGDAAYAAEEIPSDAELKTAEQLHVPLPEANASFHRLAVELAQSLPRDAVLPDAAALADWQTARRQRLREIVRWTSYPCQAESIGSEPFTGVTITRWRLSLDRQWTVPAVEFRPDTPGDTLIVVADGGRASAAEAIAAAVAQGHRVVAIDAFYLGECKLPSRDWLYALMVATVGQRPLGVQAAQVAAAARWAHQEFKTLPIVTAYGYRSSTFALVAAALEPEAIQAVRFHDSRASLKEVIERNEAVNQTPEMFCLGLLEHFDGPQLAALVAPRPVVFVQPTDRHRHELAALADLYRRLGSEHQPLP
jgi:dienelactone hydrolase